MLTKLDIHMYKIETRSLSLILGKNELKCITDLNLKSKTQKLLEENIREILQNIVLANDFLNRTFTAEQISARMN
jgi:hypothetical protein